MGPQPDPQAGPQRARRRTAGRADRRRASAVSLAAALRRGVQRAGGEAGSLERRDGRGGEHVPVPGGPALRGRPVAGTDAPARGRPGPAISAFAPSYDPLDGNHAHYTLDLSHTATAGTDSLDMAQRMGAGLVHLHLCDGNGLPADEHLVPGRGTQPTAEVCQMLAGGQFAGHVILEVSTSSARSANEREAMLAESLQFARTHLLR
ncbi:xylose isomerase-like TIM barrel family protein [Mycobacterium intracellulare 1956]|uniref:Xylose isomerase-like TIM barrel family protein n=1 Tax=Mycobacterium intracellulare 1956 TaxID=1299331 RepID=X8CAJ3_MYCIT|nr:xylose isomerase-like TIM barrel family protein [Mycobacterium intracellulare 1956]